MSILLRSPEPEPQPETGRHTNEVASSQEQITKSLYTDSNDVYRAELALSEELSGRYNLLTSDERYDLGDKVTDAMARQAIRTGFVYIHERKAYIEEVRTLMNNLPVWFEPHSNAMARGRWSESPARIVNWDGLDDDQQEDEVRPTMTIEVDAPTEFERAILLSGVTALARYLAEKD